MIDKTDKIKMIDKTEHQTTMMKRMDMSDEDSKKSYGEVPHEEKSKPKITT